uniref:Uncharacterized protein n=1 Tax=Arundo donax TaxID=35708 RepID=A0A0A9BVP7_ARUDO
MRPPSLSVYSNLPIVSSVSGSMTMEPLMVSVRQSTRPSPSKTTPVLELSVSEEPEKRLASWPT